MRTPADFDSRSYGYRKLKDLVDAHPEYEVETRPSSDGKANAVFIRRK